MKIRTITIGVEIGWPLDKVEMKRIADSMQGMRQMYEGAGLEVQSIRISTQPWPRYLDSRVDEVISRVEELEDTIHQLGIDFLSIGTVKDPKNIELIPEIIVSTRRISTSATIGGKTISQKVAGVISDIANRTRGGNGNFRFAAIANCPPDTPFFPAGYHEGNVCFSIGLEGSDLIGKAFEGVKDLVDAEVQLRRILQESYDNVAHLAVRAEENSGISFKGIDLSPAPSLAKDESIAFAFEKLGIGRFGEPGTLMIASMVTRVLRSLQVRKCGYSGLMLPILEDFGLAQRWGECMLNIDKMLLYSAICGTGLDCIPLPIDTPLEKISAMIMDVASLAGRLNKSLSARLLPVPGKKVGEMTDFGSPYLVDCRLVDPW